MKSLQFYISIITIILIFGQCTPKSSFVNLQDNSLYGLHGKLSAQDGQGKELSAILLEASALMQSARGCHLYMVSLDTENPDEVWITEIWESKEDHDNSLSLPGVKELIGKAVPLLDESPQGGQQLSVLGGLGIK